MNTQNSVPYNEDQIQRLKNVLLNHHKAGKPHYYEVYIDKTPIVTRSCDPENFDCFQHLFTNYDKYLHITIYGTNEKSTRGVRYCFSLQDEPSVEQTQKNNAALNGLPQTLDELNRKVSEAVMLKDKDRLLEDSLKENEKIKSDLKEAETYIDLLQKELDEYKSKKLHWGKINLAEATGLVLEGIARRNVHLLSKITGVENLAGIISEDNAQKEKTTPSQPTQISFEKAPQEDDPLLLLLHTCEEKLNQQELNQLQEILEKFLNEKQTITHVHELIKD